MVACLPTHAPASVPAAKHPNGIPGTAQGAGPAMSWRASPALRLGGHLPHSQRTWARWAQ